MLYVSSLTSMWGSMAFDWMQRVYDWKPINEFCKIAMILCLSLLASAMSCNSFAKLLIRYNRFGTNMRIHLNSAISMLPLGLLSLAFPHLTCKKSWKMFVLLSIRISSSRVWLSVVFFSPSFYFIMFCLSFEFGWKKIHATCRAIILHQHRKDSMPISMLLELLWVQFKA